WGVDEETLEDVIGGLLAERGLRLLVVEVGGVTGGQVVRMLTGATDRADRLAGGWVVPSGDLTALAEIAGRSLGDVMGSRNAVYSAGMAGAIAASLATERPPTAALVTLGDLPSARDDARVTGQAHLGVARPGAPPQALTVTLRAARSEIKRLAGNEALYLLGRALLD